MTNSEVKSAFAFDKELDFLKIHMHEACNISSRKIRKVVILSRGYVQYKQLLFAAILKDFVTTSTMTSNVRVEEA